MVGDRRREGAGVRESMGEIRARATLCSRYQRHTRARSGAARPRRGRGRRGDRHRLHVLRIRFRGGVCECRAGVGRCRSKYVLHRSRRGGCCDYAAHARGHRRASGRTSRRSRSADGHLHAPRTRVDRRLRTRARLRMERHPGGRIRRGGHMVVSAVEVDDGRRRGRHHDSGRTGGGVDPLVYRLRPPTGRVVLQPLRTGRQLSDDRVAGRGVAGPARSAFRNSTVRATKTRCI